MARKLSMAAIAWTPAIQAMGVPAKCTAQPMPASKARSLTCFVPKMPPADPGSGWKISTACVSASFLKQVHAEVHLQPGEALVHALLQTLAVDLRVVGLGCIAIGANLVAVLSTEHLIDGHVVCFAGEVPEGHFDTAHAARLPRFAPK